MYPIAAMSPALLDEKAADAYNRYTFSYSADIPLRGRIVCNVAGIARMEEFYLEAGKGQTFSSFIDGYLIGEKADPGEVYVTLETITGESGEFELTAFETADVPVIAPETCFIENERYRLGVELAWGGGLSYLKDKKSAVEGVENMLNHFDTGRLIQQSYYGTREAPYTEGFFMNHSWCYNPVQGGDLGMKKSKLIDAVVAENEIWVKSRPRDWGHNGGVTYSYMENRYRLEGDCIRVDNRFVDFSGWAHPVASQELPAFYTVSYFDRFWFYDGEKPWTGDRLECRPDLPFWGTWKEPCRFERKPGNTEAWAAFTDANGYGVGLYCPATPLWVAGRYEYDGSKDPKGKSTNYIAPTRRLQLRCFRPVEYSYFLCAGELSDIREKFRLRRDDITNASLDEYEK